MPPPRAEILLEKRLVVIQRREYPQKSVCQNHASPGVVSDSGSAMWLLVSR